MEFKQESNRIYMDNEQGITIAEVTFPNIKEQVVNLNHTYVDDSLRGQGVAGKLLVEAAKQLRKEKKAKRLFLPVRMRLTGLARIQNIMIFWKKNNQIKGK